jgi:hypothetical protein
MRRVVFFWIASSFVAAAAIAGFYYAIVTDGLRSQVIYAPIILSVCVVVALVTYFREAHRRS